MRKLPSRGGSHMHLPGGHASLGPTAGQMTTAGFPVTHSTPRDAEYIGYLASVLPVVKTSKRFAKNGCISHNQSIQVCRLPSRPHSAPPGDRTLNPSGKSRVLCQLS